MSNEAFERLLYTDCRPGEGLGGGGGYQVQAQSQGVTSAQVRFAVRELLYSSQVRWVNGGRAVDDFPHGLSHAYGTGYGTGQSRYLGTEANGHRQGNFIADVLLSESVGPYGVIRPAQLWQAPFWREENWPSTTAPRFGDDLDIGPLDTDEIADWLKEVPARRAGLEQLLSVLEDADGLRVNIRAKEPEQAIKWIAASTVLLPMADALATSFRVFANSIDDSRHRIVAVPKELHPNLIPGSRPKTFIIDALTDETDKVETSARARYWVGQLLDAEEPFDVVEAVELAASYGGRTEQEFHDARVAAMAVVDPDHPIDDVPAVGRWVRRSINSDHAEDAKSVVDRLISADNVRIGDLRLLDQLAADGVISVDASELRIHLLNTEVSEALAGAAPPPEKLECVALSRVQKADRESTLLSALVVAPNLIVDLLLQVAWRHGLELEPPSPAFIDRIRNFVEEWVSNPRWAFKVDQWAFHDLVVDELHGQLRGAFDAGDTARLETVFRSTIEHLVRRRNDMGDPFSWEIQACYTSKLKGNQKLLQIEAAASALKPLGTEARFAGYQAALVKWYAIDPPTALGIVRLIPEDFRLNVTITRMALEVLNERAEKPDAEVLLAIEGLDARDLLPPRSPRLTRLARSATAVERLLTKLEAPRGGDLRSLKGHLQAVRDADEDVIELSMHAFVSAAFTVRGPQLGQSVLRFLRARPAVSMARAWAPCLVDEKRGHVAASYAVTWACDTSIPDGARSEFAAQLDQRARSIPANGLAAWSAMVGNYLRSDAERTFLEQIVNANVASSGRKRSRLWGKADG